MFRVSQTAVGMMKSSWWPQRQPLHHANPSEKALLTQRLRRGVSAGDERVSLSNQKEDLQKVDPVTTKLQK